jgi:4-amino-4-deoxy-L-arabinose transferase-like glycosyltransferase
MSTVLSRSAPVAARELDSRLTHNQDPGRGRNRAVEWFRMHAATLAWLAPVIVVAGFVNSINLLGSPARTEGESIITTQAWSVLHLGQFTPYTYTYDQPPLGWIQIADLTGLADSSVSVAATRVLMVAAALVGVVLLWFLSRRIGFGRTASGIATIVFALSPLAIQLHRTVYLDNIATPWLLASLLLATTRKRQNLGYAASAVALGIAVLSQETYVLALPLVGFLAWHNAHRSTRRYTLAVATTIFTLILGSYVMFAVLRGQFVASAGHPSLVGGLQARFGDSGLGGSPGSLGSTFASWRQLDPLLFFLAPVAAIAGELVRRIRAFAIALGALIVLALFYRVDGILPDSYAVMVLPIAAIVIAGVVNDIIRRVRARGPGVARKFVAIVVATAVAGAAVVYAWSGSLENLLQSIHSQKATTQAEQWVTRNVSMDSRLIVDDSMWVDLVRAGFARDNVIWYPKLDSDAFVRSQSPNGWKDSDYVVSTQSMRTNPDATSAHSAIANSMIVASFGTGDQKVQVRKIDPAGRGQAQSKAATERSQRARLGDEITANPMLATSVANAGKLHAGDVDPRIPLLATELAPNGPLTIAGLPVVTGEAGQPIREVVLSRANGEALTAHGRLTSAGRSIVAALIGPLKAQSSKAVTGGLLIEFPVELPAGLIQ